MKKFIFSILFLSLVFNQLVAQDDEQNDAPPILNRYVGLHGAGLLGIYVFPKNSTYRTGKFDQIVTALAGLDFRAELTETAFFIAEASYYKRKMRSDDQFSVFLPALSTSVYYQLDGSQRLIDAAIGLGFQRKLAHSPLVPYFEAGLLIGFPLDKTVHQTQYFFGVSKENDLRAPNADIGGFGEIGFFMPLSQRSRLNFGLRYALTQTNVKLYEEVSVRTIPTNMYLNRLQIGVGLARKF